MVRPNPAGELDAVALETALLETWKNEQTFQQSIDSNRTGAPFIFLEGPPTANGKPGIHHVVARAYKDLVCRWKTMEGFLVERKGGWDTHGLPVEIEVQKRLDLMSNEAIEEFGMMSKEKTIMPRGCCQLEEEPLSDKQTVTSSNCIQPKRSASQKHRQRCVK